jgi:hypothetical protein
MPSNHVEVEPGVLLWIHPALVPPGALVRVLRYGDELTVWRVDGHPTLLGIRRRDTAGQRNWIFPSRDALAGDRTSGEGVVGAAEQRRAS